MAHTQQDSMTAGTARRGIQVNGVNLADTEIGANLQRLDQRIRQVCRENPATTLGVAAVAGFVIGRILTRR